jgi:hypothetical protein
MKLSIIKRQSEPNSNFDAVWAYWLMYCRAPRRETLPGEAVDLGEIGQVKEKGWERLTPYSPAEKITIGVLILKFDMTDIGVRRMLYHYHNRRHDEESWFAFLTSNGVTIMEQSNKWPDGVLICGPHHSVPPYFRPRPFSLPGISFLCHFTGLYTALNLASRHAQTLCQ